MCLDTVTARGDRLPEAMIGYKVVKILRVCRREPLTFEQKYDLQCHPSIRTEFAYAPEFFTASPVQAGQGWAMNDDEEPISAKERTLFGETRIYVPGIHAYAHREDMDYFLRSLNPYLRVVKVYLRGPICRGVQNFMDVVVYREMTIIEEVK